MCLDSKELSVNIEELVKMFSINSFAFEKVLVSGERFRRNYISSMYSAFFNYYFPFGISTFLTLVSLSDRMHISVVGFKLILQQLSITQVFGFPVFHINVGSFLAPIL